MSEMIDESEITRQIPLVAGSGSRRGAHCPTSGQLATYADTRLDATARARAEEHLADCTYCLGQVGFLIRQSRESQAESVPARLMDAVRERPGRRFGLVPVPALAAMAATALLLAVGVAWQPDRGLTPFGPAHPGSDSTGQTSSGAPMDRTLRNGAVTTAPPRILQPGDGEIVGRLPLEIRWSTSPGALQYSVQVLSLAGDLVWEGSSAGEETLVPSEVILEPGQRYYVWVEARLPSGAASKSDAVAFRVAPD